MSNCHGCSKPIEFKYRRKPGTYTVDELGTRTHNPGPPLLDGDGNQVIEDLCDKCIDESKLNKPEDYYDGLWKDSNAHESHIVERNPDDYLL